MPSSPTHARRWASLTCRSGSKTPASGRLTNVYATENRRGRIFLAGGATHRHPPASGLGSNTCVQDANNLAWKLKLILADQAGDGLLESYNQERQPVAQQVVGHAIQTLYDPARVSQVLGFKQGQTQEEGYKSLEELLFSDSPTAERCRQELREVVELQNRRSNSLGIQLGQRYEGSNAVLYDGTPFPSHQRDPVLYYEPTTHPGAYLPHAWVERDTRRLSTLDVLQHGQFGLIGGIDGDPLAPAAREVSEELGLEFPVYRIGYRCPYDDVLGEWTRLRETSDRGALLVRPDRHVAWRTVDRPEDPVHALRSALRHVLGLDS